MRSWAIILAFMLSPVAVSAQHYETFPDRVVSRSLIEDFGQTLGAADIARARSLLPVALNLIKEFEGWSEYAYNDPAGYCTIGYGHLISLSRCETTDLGEFTRKLSKSAGEELLLKDTVSARVSIQTLVNVELSDAQFGALTSFVFNIGKSNFSRSSILRLINSGEYEAAAKQFARWVYANGKLYPGLVARRSCEQTLFREHLKVDSSERFDRALCEELGIAVSGGPPIDIVTGREIYGR